MTKSKITIATLAALALADTLIVTGGTAEARSHWDAGVGIGIAAGELAGGCSPRRLRRRGLGGARLP